MIRRNRPDPRWWRSMPRIRPFHDSMRLFVAGIGVVRPLVGSRNVNRWFSRDTFADHASGSDEALAPVGDGAVRVRALLVKERVVRLPPLAVGGGPCGRGIRVRHAAQGDGDLPQLFACPGPWLDPGGLGDVHAHVEQAPLRLGIRPALAQRLRNATAPVDRHRQWRGDPSYGMSPRGGGFAFGDVPADHMPAGDRYQHDRIPMQANTVQMRHAIHLVDQRNRRPQAP